MDVSWTNRLLHALNASSSWVKTQDFIGTSATRSSAASLSLKVPAETVQTPVSPTLKDTKVTKCEVCQTSQSIKTTDSSTKNLPSTTVTWSVVLLELRPVAMAAAFTHWFLVTGAKFGAFTQHSVSSDKHSSAGPKVVRPKDQNLSQEVPP